MALSALQPTTGLPPVVHTAAMPPNATATVGGNTFTNTPPHATLAPGVSLPTAIPLPTMPRHLGPASINKPMTPSIGYGDRSFSVAAPALWNNLPLNVRRPETVHQFVNTVHTIHVLLYKIVF